MVDSTNPLDDAFGPEDQEQVAPETKETEQQEAQPVEAEAHAEADAAAQDDAAQEQAQPEPQQRNVRIPLSEHLQEREKRQAAEARAQAVEAQMQALQRQFEAMQRQTAEQAKEPAKTPDWYDDPQAATQQYVAPHIEQMRQTVLYNARLAAGAAYGQDKVMAAQEAFDGALSTGSLDPSEYQRVINAPNPFEAAVKWHEKQVVLQEVGTDPAAYRQRIIEEAMKDPDVRKRILESVQVEARQPASNDRPATTTRLPPSLNSRTAAASSHTGGSSADPGDMFSDAFSGMG
ncbi:MAG: hypothetical protein EA385_10690 [Salinarimonadaceae bacterium]|nr:MAG: hypothetical protein EA385_10690 [Salinarimonadaceae bacterium]